MKLSLDSINRMNREQFVDALGWVFEHSPWVAERAWISRPFASFGQLSSKLEEVVEQSALDEQLALLCAHPDLAGKLKMTEVSVNEQRGAGLDELSPEDYEQFRAGNQAYKDKFGFPFIIAVRGLNKDSIYAALGKRLGDEWDEERILALKEVFKIAQFRLSDLITSSNNGKLTTHVLDVSCGTPASGMKLELWEIGGEEGRRLLRSVVTDEDGRLDAPLLSGGELKEGQYELFFYVADYFREKGLAGKEPPFLECIPIRFGVSDAGSHYHVPLLVAPGGYSTYRGS
ncbi:2-oxo-4-hydroxy-4-carboxy-5-ureidoimidazoline decarboxylase [Paenibacillus sp. 1-18]|uniref:2-oxo-4-hydroxy-4-carboxy-5-ureidoimidazoline decarboxylase n=1 Tax=Paenibacillus sp. 1-18 TaxID=1333846 RepID=UPI000470E6AA